MFGPASVTWQLHADPMMWVAGIRALFLQALHPRAVRGVAQNSDFRRDAWGRLLRTVDFVGTLTYGTTAAAERAGARVRGIHRRLSAVDPATGERYAVDEPELLCWVHCAEADSFLHVVRRSGFPLTDAQADRYLAERRRAVRLVGLDPAAVPGDTAGLAAYLAATRPRLAATPEAREIAAFLLRPPVPLPLVPAREAIWGRVASLARAALPPHAQALYGRPAPDPRAVTRRLRAMGRLLRAVPPDLRWKMPPGHLRRALERLGPGARPSPDKLPGPAAGLAILDEPGRAGRDDGGDGTRWGRPG
ncbi:oxygenase MpaB family protein [Streptomyces sp. URMC 123]|uniref:oxygenase MpaB family protein n=1 Tax=Streptomyces sp. URMC 123 TaxID=3423403 RepID=UPI003F1CA344